MRQSQLHGVGGEDVTAGDDACSGRSKVTPRMSWMNEVDGASSGSGVDLSDVAEEETLEMDRFPPAGVRVGLASLDTVNVGSTLQASRLSDEECSQVSRGPVPFRCCGLAL